jgi:serine/threonine protein kinase
MPPLDRSTGRTGSATVDADVFDSPELDAQAYLAAHPEKATDKAFVVDLAYEEWCRRREAGEQPDLEAFCARFPLFQSTLIDLLGTHSFLAGNLRFSAACQPTPWPQCGRTFLGFKLIEELGRGAFARVYLAREPALGNRHVVLKVSEEGMAEAETLGPLDHPNIVRVHSVQRDVETQLTVVCMPYLGRTTLDDVLNRLLAPARLPARGRFFLNVAADSTTLPEAAGGASSENRYLLAGTYLDAVLSLSRQVADALAFIHGRRVCHGDLKPSNVLLTPAGRPMLLDFNLALTDQPGLRREGGTLPYMSPEQVRAIGQEGPTPSGLVGTASDIFSLGIMVTQLLTREHPFGPLPYWKETADLCADLLERQRQGPCPLRLRNRAVDRGLERLIARCLAYDPKDRPTANELSRALGQALSGSRRCLRTMRRHPGGVLAAAALLGGITFGGVAVLASREAPEVRLLRQAQAAHSADDIESAIKQLTQFLNGGPDDSPNLLYQRGRAYQKRGSLLAQQAEQSKDLNEKTWLSQASSSDFALAVADFQHLQRTRADGRLLACIGYCLAMQQYHGPASKFYEDALRAGHASAALHNNLGWEYRHLHMFDRAREEFDKALRLDPTLEAAHLNRLTVDLQVSLDPASPPGNREASHIEAALSSGLASAELYYEVACLYVRLGNTEPALGYLDRSLGLGLDPKKLSDFILDPLRGQTRFQELCHRPTPTTVAGGPTRLIDPGPESLD